MDDITLRYDLLLKSREYLFEDWNQKVKIEALAATLENRVPRRITPPTLSKILSTAEKMYGFIHSNWEGGEDEVEVEGVEASMVESE